MSVEMRMALRSVLRNWRHSLATLVSVALGLTAVALIEGFIRDVRSQSADFLVKYNMYGHLIIESTQDGEDDVWNGTISKAQASKVVAELDALGPKVMAYTRFLPIEGLAAGGGNSAGFSGYAFDIVSGEKMRGPLWKWNTVYGRPLRDPDKAQVLVGRGLAELMGCNFQGLHPNARVPEPDPVLLDCFADSVELTGLTEKGQVNALDVQIEGIVEISVRAIEDSWLMMPMELAKVLFRTEKIGMIGVALREGEERDEIISHLEKRFFDLHLPLRVVKWEEHKSADFYRENSILNIIFRNFIFIVVVTVCALSLANTITRSIIQRTREIGTLRALGFKKRFIRALFAWEGFFLGLLGSMAGVVLAYLIAIAVNAAELSYTPGAISQPIPFRIQSDPMIFVGLAAILTPLSGLIAWLIAVVRARKSIAASLIHN